MTIYTRWSREVRRLLEPPAAKRVFCDGWDVRFFGSDYDQELMSAWGEYTLVKMTKSTDETKAFIFKVHEDLLFQKKIDFRKKKFETRFRYLFQPSRSFWSAYAAFKILEAGFATPAVYAVGEQRKGGMIMQTCIINEALVDAKSGVDKQLEMGLNLDLLCRVGTFLRSFHRAGFYHGDMQFSNFYLQENKIGIWDLDSVQIYENKNLPEKKWMTDLGRLFSSFIQVIDSSNEKVDDNLRVVDIAEALGQGYGVNPQILMQDLKRVWLKTFTLKHQLQF